LDLKHQAFLGSEIDVDDYIASRSSHFTLRVKSPHAHRVRDCVVPKSDMGAENKEIFLVGAFISPQLH